MGDQAVCPASVLTENQIPLPFFVIARLVRATHFFLEDKLGRPHKAGDDGGLEIRWSGTVWR
jgi:hypothetical protein